MAATRSHGRLILLLLPVVVITGLWLGYQFADSEDEFTSLDRRTATTQQSILERIESIRRLALDIALAGPTGAGAQTTGTLLENWALARIEPSGKLVTLGVGQNTDEINGWLQKSRSGAAISVTADQKPMVAFFFAVPGQNNKLVIALIDPTRIFSGILTQSAQNQQFSAYLVGFDGTLLAGSNAFMGHEVVLTRSDFDDFVSKVFYADEKKGHAKSLNANGSTQHLSYAQVSTYPFAVVLRANPEATASRDAPVVLMGGGLILLLLLAGIAAARTIARRRKEPRVFFFSEVGTTPSNQPRPRPLNVSLPPSSGALASGIRKTSPPPAKSDILTREEVIEQVNRFEINASHIKDTRIVAAMLSQTTSLICDSPVLFFRFNPEQNSAILETDWGFDSGQAPVSMAFQLNNTAVKKIFDCTQGHRLASLSGYEPLASIMIQRLGVAVFEAWAVTGSRQKHTSLLGILVILRSSSQSTEYRDSIVRMMRTTGQLYAPRP